MTTKWGAFSKGCANVDLTNDATYYLGSGTSAHTGLDMNRGDGQSVVAIADGVVVENGQPWGAANKNVVVIEHTTSSGEKFLAVYGHLYGDVVAKGPITKGSYVGRVQTAGTGAHLHFGVKPGAWTGATPSGSSASSVAGNGNCSFNPVGTVDPLSYLSSHTPGGSGVSPAGPLNLVKGGGFEAGGWSAMAETNFVTYSSGQIPGESARSGSKYAATNTTISGGGIYQDVPATVAPGDTYCASAFVRSQLGGTASGTFTLWLIGGTAENGNRPYAELGTADNWTPVATCVTATQAHSAIRVQFYPTPNGGTTNIDDVNVSRSLVQGGGFEAGGWSHMADTNFVTYSSGQIPGESARSGSKYAATNTTISGGGIYQDVPATVAPGDTYCASAFVRSQVGGTASGTFTLWLIGGTAENGNRPYAELGTADNWTPVATCVTATQAHSAIRVQFYPTPNGGTTNIDDVNVSRSLVQGGGFEAGGWSHMADTNFVTYSSGQVPGEAARSGSKYAATNTTISGGGIYQDVPATVAPGDTYCASAFVRSQVGGTASGTFTLWLIGGTAENGNRPYAELGTADNWTPVATCVTATQAHSAIRVQFYPTPNGGTTNIDDVNAGNMADLPPQMVSATGAPTISGAAVVGEVLEVGGGRWLPSEAAVRYQWLADGAVIPEASGPTYRPSAEDVGARISVRATGSKAGYTPSSVTTTPTEPVAKGRIKSNTRPTIRGAAHVGATLKASPGSWSVERVEVQFQWLRNGSPISGATSARYKVRPADLHDRLSVQVTVTKPGYEAASKTSSTTARIKRA